MDQVLREGAVELHTRVEGHIVDTDLKALAAKGLAELQLPGRGPLDFRPIVDALRAINYQGWTEIFMHPVPRGIPILDSTPAVTAEINRARTYLDRCLADRN